MEVLDSILDAVGGTPLVRLTKVTRGVQPTILAKMEMLNPGGSVKDRIGLRMIEAAERAGLSEAGRHDRGTDLGQHRSRLGDRSRHPRIQVHLRDAGQDEPRESLAVEGLRRRGHHHADRSCARVARVLLPRRRPPDRGDTRRVPTEPILQPGEPRQRTRRRPAPRSGSRPTARSTCSSAESVPAARSPVRRAT